MFTKQAMVLIKINSESSFLSLTIPINGVKTRLIKS